MQVDDFDFDLPESLIALRPAQPRDTARLLHIPAAGDFGDKSVRDLPQLLRAGDALVVNTTKVIPARLIGTRLRTGGEGAKIEITLTERLGPVDWRFMKPAKKVKDGDIIALAVSRLRSPSVKRVRALRFRFAAGQHGNQHWLSLAPCRCRLISPENVRLTRKIMMIIKRLFAREEGAVAAPTAGLHFTPELVEALKGARRERFTR